MIAALAAADRDGTGPSEPRVEAAAFVLSLRSHGISDLALLRAMETVPREVFAPRRYGDLSRQDVALPLACGETMTAPTVVATMLAALAIRPGHRVLEIGTGSGYVTALLAQLGGIVHSVERRFSLAESAWYRLRSAGMWRNCDLDCRDGFTDKDRAVRFDRILINGSVPEVGPALTSRLNAGGRLVTGWTEGQVAARLLTITRGEDGTLARFVGGRMRLSRLVVNANSGRATEA